MKKKSWAELVKEHKTLLIIIIIGFFVVEVEIFAVASMKSGRQSWIQMLNDRGEVIYEVKGSTMTNFNKYYFENTFGSFDDYEVRLETKDTPFPFRAWFSAAVGLPIGLVLLLIFVLQAVMVFISGKTGGDEPIEKHGKINPGESTGFEKILFRISKFNIFIIGFLILAAVFLYWVLPNLLTFLAKVGVETIISYKWFFVGAIGAVLLLFGWFMYMKYQLAKKSMDAQTEIRKYELQLEYCVRTGKEAPALEYNDPMGTKLLEYPDNEKDDQASGNEQ